MTSPEKGTTAPGDREFPVTTWSMACHLDEADVVAYERHLERLAQRYWRPAYWYIRRSWARTDSEAQDLTQEFFATVVLDRALLRRYEREKGSFRSFLRTAIANFVRNEHRDASRHKRGGQLTFIDLEHVGEPPDKGNGSDDAFDRAWNDQVLSNAVRTMEERLRAEGDDLAVAVFRRYDLEGARATLSYNDLAAELGASADRVKRALARARDAFRDALTEIVRAYVDGPDELAQEIRRLFGG